MFVLSSQYTKNVELTITLSMPVPCTNLWMVMAVYL